MGNLKWKESDTVDLINLIIENKNVIKFLYTDLDSKHSRRLIKEAGCKYKTVKKITGVAPTKDPKPKRTELFIYN